MIIIAHRAGNDVATLIAAVQAGADVVEADVHLHRRRLEVRHAKSFGTPWLYDNRRLLPSTVPRLHLGELLDALPPATTVMLDLKGMGSTGLAVSRAVQERAPTHPLWVCARWWPQLLSFQGLPWVRTLASARNRAEVARLHRHLDAARGELPFGCSLHRSLLTAPMVNRLHEHGLVVVTWPVDDAEALREARAVDVDGVITAQLAIVREVARTN